MCRLATCHTCAKVTWKGCGMHVDQVMAGVPRADRCAGHPKSEAGSNAGRGRNWLRSLFGR